ncbi:hypothetical protein GCK72_018310 [Caenorhabditis remanei]|uniref:Suppressor of white apricot N-terminal domain-containing protein n=1 Tax=Caenorhabditis remanei TaxID=31234 RepID=A0A6A5GAA0_CAERE|nr:hypothetical protein GCK72_018310 [Caenorhabditis remanei]KAF1751756.1 hypothetical protein GCK72_018310 [Caenorhabditis remanei]
MWHEARRQEKILRTTMIDQSKRAERKRRYFENVRKDPEQFMQIHGRKAQVHADLGIARAAEDSNILRPWQGDSSITIDRFDVRSHLSKMDLMDDDDIIPKKKQEIVDEKEQIVTDFERYRVLIINDYKGVSEKSYLKKIADREFWYAEKEHSKKLEAEKKKKSAEKKSMIGFSYEDSEVVKGGKTDKGNSDEESEDEEIDDMQDLDVDLDTSVLTPETQRTVNKSGEEFGVRRGLFCALLKADQQALRDAAQLKQIDRQKAQLSGRESKHERMLLRQQRQAIVGKKGMVVSENGATATLLGFINQSQKKSKIDEMIKDMEGSDNDDDRRAKAEFITTFGGGADRDSDDEVKKETVGPELPSEEYRKILKLSQNRRKDDDDKVDWEVGQELDHLREEAGRDPEIVIDVEEVDPDGEVHPETEEVLETVKEVVHVIVVEAPEIESVADRTIESMSPREGVIKAEARVEDVTEVEVPAENVKEAEATVGNGNDPMNVIVIDQEKTEVKEKDDQEVREKARA